MKVLVAGRLRATQAIDDPEVHVLVLVGEVHANGLVLGLEAQLHCLVKQSSPHERCRILILVNSTSDQDRRLVWVSRWVGSVKWLRGDRSHHTSEKDSAID